MSLPEGYDDVHNRLQHGPLRHRAQHLVETLVDHTWAACHDALDRMTQHGGAPARVLHRIFEQLDKLQTVVEQARGDGLWPEREDPLGADMPSLVRQRIAELVAGAVRERRHALNAVLVAREGRPTDRLSEVFALQDELKACLSRAKAWGVLPAALAGQDALTDAQKAHATHLASIAIRARQEEVRELLLAPAPVTLNEGFARWDRIRALGDQLMDDLATTMARGLLGEAFVRRFAGSRWRLADDPPADASERPVVELDRARRSGFAIDESPADRTVPSIPPLDSFSDA